VRGNALTKHPGLIRRPNGGIPCGIENRYIPRNQRALFASHFFCNSIYRLVDNRDFRPDRRPSK
jgi:hypothetical protein